MTRLVAFGDSFVVGDQDDFGPDDCNYNPDFPPTHNMNYHERVNFLKENISFASIVAKKLGYDYLNLAQRGASNFAQLDKLMMFIKEGDLKNTDIILFGITISMRDRGSLIPLLYHEGNKLGPGIITDELLENEKYLDIEEYDYFYIISILDSISKKYKVPIIKFNLFSNTLCNISGCVNYSSSNFIGLGESNNTLVDVLNDTWGQPNKEFHLYHTLMEIPAGYEKFYTWNKHPSIEGHKKIADWLLDIVDWNNLKIHE